MNHQFELAGGSVIGREHLRVGKNNQDAVHWIHQPHFTIAIVCDGCSSGAHSEVGAKLGAKLTAELMAQRCSTWDSGAEVSAYGLETQEPEFWHTLHQDLLQHLQRWAHDLGGDGVHPIYDYLLFTLVGVLMTPTVTSVFAIGDGAIAVNGEQIAMDEVTNNMPPYLAYGLLPSPPRGINPDQLQFKVYQQIPTTAVQSVLIGSDGVQDLIQAATQLLPGKSATVGEIHQFWQQDCYFKNPDQVRRRLSLINRNVLKPDWQTQEIRQENGLLPDDTTLVVIRRR